MIPPAACEKALSRSAASVRRRPSADFHAADFLTTRSWESSFRGGDSSTVQSRQSLAEESDWRKAKEADNKKSSWAEEHRRWTAKRLTNMRAPGVREVEKRRRKRYRGSQRFQIEEIIQGKRRLWKGSRREEDGDKVYWDRRCLTLNFPMRRFSCTESKGSVCTEGLDRSEDTAAEHSGMGRVESQENEVDSGVDQVWREYFNLAWKQVGRYFLFWRSCKALTTADFLLCPRPPAA